MKSAAAGSMANCSSRCSKMRRSGLFTPTSPEMTIPSNQARKSNLDELSPLGMLGDQEFDGLGPGSPRVLVRVPLRGGHLGEGMTPSGQGQRRAAGTGGVGPIR